MGAGGRYKSNNTEGEEQPKTDSSALSSKFKDNKLNAKPQIKSRNKEKQIGLNNPNDMMFFNSNREKSPVPGADS